MRALHLLSPAILLAMSVQPAAAQEERRWRVSLGPQVVPAYPGADRQSLRPYINVDRVRGDAPFRFEAPDESAGFRLLGDDGLSFGPSLNFEGRRRERDAGGAERVGRTIELGGFVQYQFLPAVRVRGELRQGLGGHRGLVGNIGADYVARDDDRWLYSLGPRVTFADGRYHRAYFDVTPTSAARSALPVYDAGSGVQAVGAAGSVLHQFGDRWGVVGYAKYDRLVGGAADSPIVRSFGDRNQLSAGVALSYSFTTGGRR